MCVCVCVCVCVACSFIIVRFLKACTIFQFLKELSMTFVFVLFFFFFAHFLSVVLLALKQEVKNGLMCDATIAIDPLVPLKLVI